MGALDILLERNCGAGKPFAAGSWAKLCIVTCDDAALTGQLEACLGLGPGEAVMIRLPAGGGGLSQDVVQRAVAKAVLVDTCDEVLVLTHSSCTLYNLSSSALAEALGRARIPRAAVPHELRELVGAGRDPRELARDTAAQLRLCPFLPAGMAVHLAHLDEATGQLTVIENGDEIKSPRAETAASSSASPPLGPAAAQEPALAPLSLPALAFPEWRPISVEMPTVSPLPSVTVPLPLSTALPQVTVVLPTVSELPALSIALPAIGELPAPSAAPAPIQVGMPKITVSLDPAAPQAPRPPPPPAPAPSRNAAPASPKDAKKTKGKKPPPSPAAQASTIATELAAAVDKVRAFALAELPREERQRLSTELGRLGEKGAPVEELLKVAFQPILASEGRYRVLDELLMMKDSLSRLPTSKVGGLLQSMLR